MPDSALPSGRARAPGRHANEDQPGGPASLPDGQGQLTNVDLASADRIEVLRGPFSALYGNASGGVIRVFTQDGAGPPVATAGAAAGSNGVQRESLTVAGASGALGYVL